MIKKCISRSDIPFQFLIILLIVSVAFVVIAFTPTPVKAASHGPHTDVPCEETCTYTGRTVFCEEPCGDNKFVTIFRYWCCDPCVGCYNYSVWTCFTDQYNDCN